MDIPLSWTLNIRAMYTDCSSQVAKDLGKKFATGSSVTKVPSGGEEIVVQGDVSDELHDFLLEKYKEIPEDNIELVDDKKKKKATAG